MGEPEESGTVERTTLAALQAGVARIFEELCASGKTGHEAAEQVKRLTDAMVGDLADKTRRKAPLTAAEQIGPVDVRGGRVGRRRGHAEVARQRAEAKLPLWRTLEFRETTVVDLETVDIDGPRHGGVS